MMSFSKYVFWNKSYSVCEDDIKNTRSSEFNCNNITAENLVILGKSGIDEEQTIPFQLSSKCYYQQGI